MKRLLSLVAFFATVQASAQQVNPVPDYVFRNQMSVGRNAVTDTAAYFSIGPRYGATKGFMPPIVGDTATFSSGKRNGLLIFSVQKNKFLYWDSVRVQWSDMAGGSGSYILAGDTSAMLAPYLRKVDTTSMLTAYLRKGDTTAMLSPYYRSATASAALALKLNISDTSSMLANYIRHAGYGLTKSGQSFIVDTLNIATRAWRQKGLDSLAALEVSGSGTSNIITKFITASTVGNSQIFDNGTNVGVNNTAPESKLHVGNISGNVTTPTAIQLDNTYRTAGDAFDKLKLYLYKSATETYGLGLGGLADLQYWAGSSSTGAHRFFTSQTERLRITSSGNVGVGTTNPIQKFVVSNSGSEGFEFVPGASSNSNQLLSYNRATSAYSDLVTRAATYNIQIGTTNAAYIFANGRVGINTTTDAGYQLDVNGTLRSVNGANFATTSGNVGIGTASPGSKLTVNGLIQATNGNDSESGDFTGFTIGSSTTGGARTASIIKGTSSPYNLIIRSQNNTGVTTGSIIFQNGSSEHARINDNGELIVGGSGTDAGDYKLQVVGNARVGTGKLDIASNTTFGIGVARSGTSEVAGQIYNSNGILYLGAESSAGGQIFSGSSAYAGVIGTGANYPLQFAVNNITRGGFSTSGNLLLGFTTDSYFLKLQVNGSIFTNNQFFGQGANAQLSIDSSTNISPLYVSAHSLTGSSAQGLFYGSTTWNTTGNPSLIDLAITNTASGSDANYIKISDGSNIFRVTKAAEVVTAAPTGGSIRKWKLGEAATVSPTSPNRTIRVEIDGTVYYLHAKTTND